MTIFAFSPPASVHGPGFTVSIEDGSARYETADELLVLPLEIGTAPVGLGLAEDPSAHHLASSRVAAALRAIGVHAIVPEPFATDELFFLLSCLAPPATIEVLRALDELERTGESRVQTDEFDMRLDASAATITCTHLYVDPERRLTFELPPDVAVRAVAAASAGPQEGGEIGFAAGFGGGVAFGELGPTDVDAMTSDLGASVTVDFGVECEGGLITVHPTHSYALVWSEHAHVLRRVSHEATLPLLGRVLWGDGTRDPGPARVVAVSGDGRRDYDGEDDPVALLRWLAQSFVELSAPA